MTRADELRQTIADAQAELDALEQPDRPVDSWPCRKDDSEYVYLDQPCPDVDAIAVAVHWEHVAPGNYGVILTRADAAAMALRMLALAGVKFVTGVDEADGKLTAVLMAVMPDGSHRVINRATCYSAPGLSTDAHDMISKQRVLDFARDRMAAHASINGCQDVVRTYQYIIREIESWTPALPVDDSPTPRHDCTPPVETTLRVMSEFDAGGTIECSINSDARMRIHHHEDRGVIWFNTRTSEGTFIRCRDIPDLCADICTIAGVNLYQPVIELLQRKRLDAGNAPDWAIYNDIIAELTETYHASKPSSDPRAKCDVQMVIDQLKVLLAEIDRPGAPLTEHGYIHLGRCEAYRDIISKLESQEVK